MSWLQELLGLKGRCRPSAPVPVPREAAPAITQAVVPPGGAAPETLRLLESTAAARAACYGLLGNLTPEVPAALLNPAGTGGPAWPSMRQGWNVVQRQDTTLVISNGLSDPFDPPRSIEGLLGFGVEVYAEVRGQLAQNLARSWLFDLIYQVSQNVAHHGQFGALIARHGAVSMLLEVKGLPAEWMSPEGMAGLLIGLPAVSVPASFATPQGTVRLLPVTLLHPREMAFLESSEDVLGNRRALVQRLSALPDGHVNDLRRAPLSDL